MMPGGSPEAYKFIQPIVEKVAAQVDDGPCVTYIGDGGAGNFVKMVHNGIEYGDMQLIAEGYDILKNIGGLTNEEICIAFNEWNKVGLFAAEALHSDLSVHDHTGMHASSMLMPGMRIYGEGACDASAGPPSGM